jgi:hypothetical protein
MRAAQVLRCGDCDRGRRRHCPEERTENSRRSSARCRRRYRSSRSSARLDLAFGPPRPSRRSRRIRFGRSGAERGVPRNSGGAIPALKAARTAFTWQRVSERTATCAGRTLEDSFLFRDPLGVGSSNALAARPDGSVPRRLASSSAASRSDASSPSSSCLSALGRSFGNRYRRNVTAMSTAPAACGEETWLAGVGGASGADASENRSGVGC